MSTVRFLTAVADRQSAAVRGLTGTLATRTPQADNRGMVSPGVIAGFAAIDASVLGQVIYAVRSYERHHGDDAEAHVDHPGGPAAIHRGSATPDGERRRSRLH
jgi:hypothetical protein